MDAKKISYAAEASLLLAILCPAIVIFSPYEVPEIILITIVVGYPLTLFLANRGRKHGGEAKIVANIAIVLSILGFLLVCMMPAVSYPREPARGAQFTNSLKQVGMALHNYREAHGRFPPAVVRDAENRALYSWRVLILPYMEQAELYREFHLDEPWDSPHNLKLLEKIPSTYGAIGVETRPGDTFIQVFVGPGTLFENPQGEPFDSIENFPDEPSQTILAVESRVPVPWTAPQDLPYDPKGPLPKLGGGYLRNRRWFQLRPTIHDFRSLRVDGSVQRETLPIKDDVLRAEITRNGREGQPN